VTIYWKISGITGDDLASGDLTGSGTIKNGKLEFQNSLKIDSDYGEQFSVSVYSDSVMTQQIGTTASVAVQEAPVVRGNSLYTIVDGPSWTQAEANAVKLGGHLVTLNSKEEDIWLSSNLYGNQYLISGGTATAQLLVQPYFIGLNDQQVEGSYQWASGEPLNYAGFAPPPTFDQNHPNTAHTDVFVVNSNASGTTGHWINVDNEVSWYRDGNSPGVSRIIKGIAETPFIRRGDSAYVIVQGPTWEEAEANAVKLGGHLVTINDSEENQFLFKTILAQVPNEFAFIGLTDKNKEGEFLWSSGEVVNFTNWEHGEPSRTGIYGEEDYAHMFSYNNYRQNDPNALWNDINNGGAGGKIKLGIAEIKLAPNNVPTGSPSITGSLKAGSTITIDATTLKDADNFTGYTPTYNYSFEVSSDNGVTWTKLTSTDATDNNTTYTLTTAEVGKQVRGVVSYLDGNGTNEAVNSVSSVVLPNNPPTQEVFTNKTQIAYTPSKSVTVPLQYKTSAGDAQLSGLTLNVHYNSSILTPITTNNGISDQLPVSITTNKIVPDTNNLDNDPLTDKIIQLVWATFDNTFPNKTLPTTLANLTFNTSSASADSVTGAPVTTNLRYTASATAAGYDFLTNYTTLKATSFNLDVDGDGQVKPLTDGLMIIRKLLGPAFDADALTFKAIGSGATRTTAEIHDFIQSGIDGGMLDIDKNGKTAPLTDGLMVIRRLLGPAFDGDALTFKALASDSPYFGKSDAPALVSANIDSLHSF
jgi:hypothetical protein